MVRAKVKCDYITEHEGGFKRVHLMPVTSGSPENDQFFKWTPNGSIDLGILNEEASKHFTPGKEYYVDFTPADQ